MVTCNDCIHRCVCPIADGCEYADEQHIRDDCEYFAPTADVVEVVRCKDCKHKNPIGNKCLRDNLWHDSDDFCSYGERKEQT